MEKSNAVTKSSKWKNKQRVLIFCSRGILPRGRHLMKDFLRMMPHSKSDTKLDRASNLSVINEVCEMKNCQLSLFFESRKQQDLYLWMGGAPNGPSVRFLVENLHTMDELKMTGNCLKGSRPVLCFSSKFDSNVHLRIVKELCTQIFSTPHMHPKSQPFVDHVFSFCYCDNRIWFRNFQIVDDGESLLEIGPRMTLNVIKVFNGGFSGMVLYENPHYISPNEHRRVLKQKACAKHRERFNAKQLHLSTLPKQTYRLDPTDAVFQTEDMGNQSNDVDVQSNKSDVQGSDFKSKSQLRKRPFSGSSDVQRSKRKA